MTFIKKDIENKIVLLAKDSKWCCKCPQQTFEVDSVSMYHTDRKLFELKNKIRVFCKLFFVSLEIDTFARHENGTFSCMTSRCERCCVFTRTAIAEVELDATEEVTE